MEKRNKPSDQGSVKEADASAPRVPKAGDTVHVVTFRDGHKPALATRVRDGGKVDLTFEFDGKSDLAITSSPFDPSGTLPDSWHFPEE